MKFLKNLKIFVVMLILMTACSFSKNTQTLPIKISDRPFLWDKHVVTWSYDCNENEKYVINIRDGFEYWNSIAERKFLIEKSCNSDVDIKAKVVDVESPDDALANAPRLYNDDLSISKVRIIFWKEFTDLDSLEKRNVVSRHEVGHAIGLEHLSSNCIMHAEMSDTILYEGCDTEIEYIYNTYGD